MGCVLPTSPLPPPVCRDSRSRARGKRESPASTGDEKKGVGKNIPVEPSQALDPLPILARRGAVVVTAVGTKARPEQQQQQGELQRQQQQQQPAAPVSLGTRFRQA